MVSPLPTVSIKYVERWNPRCSLHGHSPGLGEEGGQEIRVPSTHKGRNGGGGVRLEIVTGLGGIAMPNSIQLCPPTPPPPLPSPSPLPRILNHIHIDKRKTRVGP